MSWKLQGYRPAFSLKKRLQHGCFLKKFLKTAFFCRTPHCSLNFFETLCDDRFFRRSLCTKLTFSYFLCHCFDFLHGSWLFGTCFHNKIFSKCKFRTHYSVHSNIILIESLKFRLNH